MKPATEMDHSELDDEIAITRTYATSTRERKKWKRGSRNSSRNDETVPSTPDAEVIAARLAEFDRDYPIPRMGHGH